MSGERVPWSRVQQELARARGSRRLLPWALLTAAGGGALGAFAGGGVRGALSLGAIGLVFALFVWVTSVARCPSCGARLATRGSERLRGCPRCRASFD